MYLSRVAVIIHIKEATSANIGFIGPDTFQKNKGHWALWRTKKRLIDKLISLLIIFFKAELSESNAQQIFLVYST
jgi:hypothetical protein